MQRVQKILGNYGICSRRKGEKLIKKQAVKINNKLATLGDKADLETDKIKVKLDSLTKKRLNQLKEKESLGGYRITENEATITADTIEKQQLVYIALNKPTDYITSTTSSQGKSIMELLTENNFIGSVQPKIPPRVYPAGRLDKDSEGLVLLTNDGDLTEKITHPKFEHKKVYQVWINKKLTQKDKEKLESGFQLEDRKKEQVQGIKVKNLKNDNKEQIVTVALKEGKYRQIRRMFGQLGYKIKKLKRIRISKLSLGLLPESKWKFVEQSDII